MPVLVSENYTSVLLIVSSFTSEYAWPTLMKKLGTIWAAGSIEEGVGMQLCDFLALGSGVGADVCIFPDMSTEIPSVP